MPTKIDQARRDRAVRLVLEHRAEYLSTARAIAAVTRQEGVGAESLRRWVVQADIDSSNRDGQTSEEHAEIRRLKAKNRRLHEDVAILKAPLFPGTRYPSADPRPRGATVPAPTASQDP